MSQIDREKIEGSLQKKGFVLDSSTHHKYFHHTYKGKETGIHTYTSHGSGYKVYSDSLLSKMKVQLKLDTLKELRDLLTCPMDAETYNEKMIRKGIFPKDP